MPPSTDSSDSSSLRGRRRALAIFVNTAVASIGGGLTALLGAFALRPQPAPRPALRWFRAGTTEDLKPDEPVPRVLAVSRVDGWYRERARQTVFLVWDGDRTVRALSATCTHLGCQVRWDGRGKEIPMPVSRRRLRGRRQRRRRTAAAAARHGRGADRSGRQHGAGAAMKDWLNARTGYREAAHVMLDEPLPPGTGWFFTLGSVLLALLSVQLLTGAFLTLYYAPTPDHAYDSVRFITALPAGRIVRGLHHYGASFIVVALALHMLRVIAFGSYKPPREVTWLSGLALLALVLGFALTGYLLPWDQRAYWATVVTINIAQLTPLGGEIVAGVLRGGDTIGALTLTRWYAAHVIFLPAALVLLVVAHVCADAPSRHLRPGPAARRSASAVLSVPGITRRDRRHRRPDRSRRVRAEGRARAGSSRRSDRRHVRAAAGVVLPRSVSAVEVLSGEVGSRRRDGDPRHRRGLPGAAAVDRPRPGSRSAEAPEADDRGRDRRRGRRRPDDARLARQPAVGRRGRRHVDAARDRRPRVRAEGRVREMPLGRRRRGSARGLASTRTPEWIAGHVADPRNDCARAPGAADGRARARGGRHRRLRSPRLAPALSGRSRSRSRPSGPSSRGTASAVTRSKETGAPKGRISRTSGASTTPRRSAAGSSIRSWSIRTRRCRRSAIACRPHSSTRSRRILRLGSSSGLGLRWLVPNH